MFISNLIIKNYRLFDKEFKISNLNVPDGVNNGTGLTAVVGENGCGKTTILDSIACTLLEYKAESFIISDMNFPNQNTEIIIETKDNFNVKGVFPNPDFEAKGFRFIGKTREKTNKNKLQSIVMSDQLYISTNNEKPKPGAADLRMTVTNSFGTRRFNELDVLYLDKNRLYQTRSGTYSETRFDRIMEDFNFQYYKKQEVIENLNTNLNEKVKKELSNKNLTDAINKFKELSGYSLKLDFIDNYLPFKKASLVVETSSNMQIDLASLGSGYEMNKSKRISFHILSLKKLNQFAYLMKSQQQG